MLTELHHHHSRYISTALLALVVLSVLQFCMMTMTEGQGMHYSGGHEAQGHQEQPVEMSDHGRLFVQEHNCCAASSDTLYEIVDRKTVCPDCEDSDPVLKMGTHPDLKPLYTLLYVVVPQTLNETLQTRTWQTFTEPEILSSQPGIYLAKASFLE